MFLGSIDLPKGTLIPKLGVSLFPCGLLYIHSVWGWIDKSVFLQCLLLPLW